MVAHHRLLKGLRFLGQHERGLLLGLLLVMIAARIFAELGELAVEPSAGTFDRSILLAMRADSDLSDPIGPEWFEGMARDMTAFGGAIVQMMVALAVIGFLLLERKRHAAVFVLVAVVGGVMLGIGLKEFFARPRPELISREILHIDSASFPSGHSMMAAVTYLTLGALLARTQRSSLVRAYVLLLAILLTVVVGLTRIYLGVHWPTDVLAGWIAGAAWALLCWTIALRLQRNRVVEAPAVESPVCEEEIGHRARHQPNVRL
jgi:undecaprenyl-diphosphatase